MKKLLIGFSLAAIIASCGNAGNTDSDMTDTTSPASGATGMGPDGTANDTTGLDVGAVQPIDSNARQPITEDVPGADRSGVKYKIGADSNNSGQ